MEDLKKLEEKIIQRLDEIRNKDNKTLNEREEYKEKQETLREIGKIERLIKRMNEETK